jgi:hypothetical protein
MSDLYGLSDYAADLLVGELDKRRANLRRNRTSKELRGPSNARFRKDMLAREQELEYAISAINTGRGITRRTAMED